MPRKIHPKPDVEQEQSLFDWLRMFDVPPWLYTMLESDDEDSADQAPGTTESTGLLHRLDPARFQAELYRNRGGLLREVAGLPHSAIAELRSLIPPPDPVAPATKAPATKAPATKAPATEAPATEAPATEAPATEAPATEAPATDEYAGTPDDAAFELPPLDDERVAKRRDQDNLLPPDHPDFTLPPLDDDLNSGAITTAPSLADPPQQYDASKSLDSTLSSTMDVEAPAMETTPEQKPSISQKRPRRKVMPAPDRAAGQRSATRGTTKKPAAKPKTAATTPVAAKRTSDIKPAATAFPTQVQLVQTDSDLAKLLHLWSELHPQGRRAALWYLSALVAENR